MPGGAEIYKIVSEYGDHASAIDFQAGSSVTPSPFTNAKASLSVFIASWGGVASTVAVTRLA